MDTSTPSAADGLLEQLRRRTEKLLGDLNRDQSEWEFADFDPAVKEQSRLALANALHAARQLSTAINTNCPSGQDAVDQENEGNPDDQ